MDTQNNDLTSLLDEMYDDIIEEEVKELGINIEDENYKILDAGQANFFLRRLSEIDAEMTEIDDMCDNEIAAFTQKVDNFRNSKKKNLESTANYFSMLLERFAQSELANSNKKSLKLPFGSLQFKKSPDKYEYDDQEIMSFIENNQLTGLLRTKTELNKPSIKKALEMTDKDNITLGGIKIEGVSFVEGETKFSVKTSK